MKRIIGVMLSLTLLITVGLSTVVVADAGTMKLNKASATLSVGKTLNLKVNYAIKTVKWTTSDKSIATVKSTGLRTAIVTAKKPGTVAIRAKVNGKIFKCKIKTIFGVGSRQNPAVAKAGITFTNILKQKYYYKAEEVLSGNEALALYKTIDANTYDFLLQYDPKKFAGKKMVCIKFYVKAISGLDEYQLSSGEVFSRYSLYNADCTKEIEDADWLYWDSTAQYKPLSSMSLFNGGSGDYYEFFLLPENINEFTLYHYDKNFKYYWVSYQL